MWYTIVRIEVEKMKDKKTIIYMGCGVAIILFVGILVFVISPKKEMNPSSPNEVLDNTPVQQVEPEQAIDIYNDMTNNCKGTLVWDLDPDEKVEIAGVDDLGGGACQKDNYYSKMIGYTYDLDGNLVIHANVLKNVDGELRKLDDTVVGSYSEESLDNSLNFGTTYEYIYKPDGKNYTLIEVKLMELPPEE